MNTLLKTPTLTLLIALVTACGVDIPSLTEPKADVSAPAAYSKNGLEFQYPGNWKKGEELDVLGVRQVSVESSGSAVVLVQKFPALAADGLAAYAKDYSTSLKDNVPVGKVSAFTIGPIGKQGDYESIKLEFSITVLSETVPHECTIFRKAAGPNVLFIIAQAATEDLPNARPGFDLVRKSLKLKGP